VTRLSDRTLSRINVTAGLGFVGLLAAIVFVRPSESSSSFPLLVATWIVAATGLVVLKARSARVWVKKWFGGSNG
jgi:uncharacterized membrane protein